MRRLYLYHPLDEMADEIEFYVDKSISTDIIKEIDIVLNFEIFDLIFNKMGYGFEL